MLEYGNMFQKRRQGHAEGLRQFLYRRRAGDESLQHGPAGRIAERAEQVAECGIKGIHAADYKLD